MRNMTMGEFEEAIEEGWEIDFLLGDAEFCYRRYGEAGGFYVGLFSGEVTFYERRVETMAGVKDEILSLVMRDGRTLAESDADITVVASS